MKFRLFSFLICAFIVVAGFSSCTQDYICQCTITYTGQPGLPDSSATEYNIKDTKKKAKSACESHSGNYDTNGITTKEECKLF